MPRLVNGNVFVPVRFVAETLGAQVAWDGANFTAVIVTQSPEAPVEAPKTIKDIDASVSTADVKSIELFSLSMEKLKDYSREEFESIVGYYNSSTITDDMMPMMLAGNSMVITLNDDGKITFTSYGSKTNIVANRVVKGEAKTYHLICPEIAEILLGSQK